MFCSCRKENRFEWQVNQRHMEVSLNKESDSLYVIHLNTDQPSHSVWKLPYPVYQFDYGDVTGDGMPGNYCVGYQAYPIRPQTRQAVIYLPDCR